MSNAQAAQTNFLRIARNSAALWKRRCCHGFNGMIVPVSFPIQRAMQQVKDKGIAIAGVVIGWSQIRKMTHMTADVSEGVWVACRSPIGFRTR